MSALLPAQLALIGVFALAVCIAVVQVLRHAPSRRAVLLLLQLPCAVMLLAALLLVDDDSTTGLVVLTPGADPDAVNRALPGLRTVALPGVTGTEHAEFAPDLATALRRHPSVSHLHVVGSGLSAHDREALGDRDVSADLLPTVSQPTLIDLHAPGAVAAGSLWVVRGQVRGAVQTLELLDPAQQVISTATPDQRGHFALNGLARGAGSMLFTLRLRDGDVTLQTLPLPIHATEPTPLRARLLAAVPSPDLKYLRRWALDAGVALDTRIALAPGVVQGSATAALDAATLAQLDLLIVDERSWPQLARQRELMRAAVADGMGLLLRVTGPVSDATLQDFGSLGLALSQTGLTPRRLQLDAGIDGSPDSALHGWPLRSDSDRQSVVLADATGAPLAAQASLGQGRVGAFWLLDSFRLHTRGARERHATLWADQFTSLARARGPSRVILPTLPSVGQRAVVCRAEGELQIRAPGAGQFDLLRDPVNPDCAAFWPFATGWHTLLPATAAQGSSAADMHAAADLPAPASEFYVHDPSQIASLHAQQIRDATAAMVNRSDPPTPTSRDRESWRRALLAAWLLLSAVLWWLERRTGRAATAAARAT